MAGEDDTLIDYNEDDAAEAAVEPAAAATKKSG